MSPIQSTAQEPRHLSWGERKEGSANHSGFGAIILTGVASLGARVTKDTGTSTEAEQQGQTNANDQELDHSWPLPSCGRGAGWSGFFGQANRVAGNQVSPAATETPE